MWGSQGSAGPGTALVVRGSLSKLDSRRDALRKSCARMGWRRVGTWNGEPELAAVTYLGVSGRILVTSQPALGHGQRQDGLEWMSTRRPKQNEPRQR